MSHRHDFRIPLLPVALSYLHITYHSRLYAVAGDDAGDFHAQLNARVPSIESIAL